MMRTYDVEDDVLVRGRCHIELNKKRGFGREQGDVLSAFVPPDTLPCRPAITRHLRWVRLRRHRLSVLVFSRDLF